MYDVKIIEKPYDRERVRFQVESAINQFEHQRTSAAKKNLLNVLEGLCRQYYLKGEHEGIKEASAWNRNTNQ